MVIKRVNPISCAKIAGVLYALFGLIAGMIVSLVSMAFGGAAAGEHAGMAMFGALFGIGAIVLMPIFYGLLGFVGALVGAFLYNLAAGWTGGIEIETS
jgi:hypothetical protein